MDLSLLDALIELEGEIPGEHDHLWRRGDLSFLLHDGQKKIQRVFTENPSPLQVLLCARGFGKTFWGATAGVSQILKKDRSRVKIATEFQTDLESLIIPNFEQVLETCPESIAPKWRPSRAKFLTDSGSVIDLIGLDRKPNGLRGQHNVDLIILEEAGFISKLEKIYRSVIVPITTHRPSCKIVAISTPPESPEHYFWELVDRADIAGSLSVFTIDDNPLLSRDDIKRIEDEMGGRSSPQFRREYLCERIIDPTLAVLPEWGSVKDDVVVKVDSLYRPPFFKPVVSIDLGLNDDCGIVFGYWDFERAKAVVQAELLLSGVNSKQLVERCLEVERLLWGDVTPMRWADGSLFTINDLCTLHHYSVAPVRKDFVEAQVNTLRLMLGARQIEISSQCVRTIKQCATGLWNKNKKEFARTGSSHLDLLAALVYFVRHLNKENPFPRDYGFNPETMMRGRTDPQYSPGLAQLASILGPKTR